MKKHLLGALCAIALLIPARAVKCAESEHNFAKWEKEIAAYEEQDRREAPPKDAILFTGASTIRRWTSLKQDFPNLPVMNRGVGGSEVVDITHFADRIVFPYESRLIFLRSGGNDIKAGKSPEKVFDDFKEFVTKVRDRLPETEIVFISQNPTIARWDQREQEQALNKMIEQYAAKTPHLKYLDISSLPLGADGKPRAELFVEDKLHFNAEGYKLLADAVRPYLPKPDSPK